METGTKGLAEVLSFGERGIVVVVEASEKVGEEGIPAGEFDNDRADTKPPASAATLTGFGDTSPTFFLSLASAALSTLRMGIAFDFGEVESQTAESSPTFAILSTSFSSMLLDFNLFISAELPKFEGAKAGAAAFHFGVVGVIGSIDPGFSSASPVDRTSFACSFDGSCRVSPASQASAVKALSPIETCTCLRAAGEAASCFAEPFEDEVKEEIDGANVDAGELQPASETASSLTTSASSEDSATADPSEISFELPFETSSEACDGEKGVAVALKLLPVLASGGKGGRSERCPAYCSVAVSGKIVLSIAFAPP